MLPNYLLEVLDEHRSLFSLKKRAWDKVIIDL